MTYEAWHNHCVEIVKAPMTIEELRHDCGRLASAEPPNPEVLLMHAMLALDQAQKDAARYRWLRDAHPATESVIAVDWRDPRKAMRHGDLDAAIDASMKEPE